MPRPVKKQINIKMPEALIEALKARAEAEGDTFTDVVIQFCEQGLGMPMNEQPTKAKAVVDTPMDVIQVHIDSRIADLEERWKPEVAREINEKLESIYKRLDALELDLGEFAA